MLFWIRHVVLVVLKALLNVLYRAFTLFPRKNIVVFASRQSSVPSYDFMQIGNELEKRGFACLYLVCKLSKKTAPLYFFHSVREVYSLARCRLCFLDRYDPIVSMVNFTYEGRDYGTEENSSSGLHTEFPCEPVVIQLWHAFGAFKSFGYQSTETIEGHSLQTALDFSIHRNYSWIICTGEENRKAFAEAFGYPIERVIPLGRPELDHLKGLEAERVILEKDQRPIILFVPTLRKSTASPHPLKTLYGKEAWHSLEENAEVVWSFHPLEDKGIAAGGVNEWLPKADIVITDYSSTVYEAYLLGKEVLFYVPDINDYRKSPGLNVDPVEKCSSISFGNEEDLFAYINNLLAGDPYPWEELEAFIGNTFEDIHSSSTTAIIDFALSHTNFDIEE